MEENKKKEPTKEELQELCLNIFRKTAAYELESLDSDGRHIHSPRWIEEHPERADNPYFTEDEEIEHNRWFTAFCLQQELDSIKFNSEEEKEAFRNKMLIKFGFTKKKEED